MYQEESMKRLVVLDIPYIIRILAMWLPHLLCSDLCQHIKMLNNIYIHSALNPHFWLSPSNARL